MTVLLTGFAPFGGESVNPSWEIAQALDGDAVAGHRIVARQLPCAFAAVGQVLEAEIAALTPDFLLLVGQAGGRSRIGIERVAINVRDARMPDNADEQPVDLPVVPGGPDAYFATLPVKAILARLTARGIPAEVSNTAGTFVCNYAFYLARHLAATRFAGLNVGLIHVPYTPAQAVAHAGAPSMSLLTLHDALSLATEVALTAGADIVLGAGADH